MHQQEDSQQNIDGTMDIAVNPYLREDYLEELCPAANLGHGWNWELSSNLKAFEKMGMFSDLFNRTEHNILIVNSTNILYTADAGFFGLNPHKEVGEANMVNSVDIKFAYGGKNFDAIIFVRANQMLRKRISPILKTQGHRLHVLDNDGSLIGWHHATFDNMTKLDPDSKPICYAANLQEAYAIATQPGHTEETKINTLIYALVPHVVPYMVETYDVRPVPAIISSTGSISDGPPASTKEVLIWSAVALLIPAYSRNDLFKKQLHTRLSAALASAGRPEIPKDDVDHLVEVVGIKPIDSSKHLLTLLGHIVAIDKHLNYDARVKTVDLGTLEDISLEYEVDTWFGALFEQARLVYTDFHTASLNFAIYVIEPFKECVKDPIGEFKRELGNLEAVALEVLNTKYSGVTGALPDSQFIRNYPRFAYMGCKYHMKMLDTPEEKAAFEKFAISAIRSMIDSDSAKKACDVYVSAMGSPTTSVYVAILESVSLEVGNKVMNTVTDEERAEIMAALEKKKKPGAWATRELEEERRRIRTQLITTAKDAVNERFRSLENSLQQQVNMIPDQEQRQLAFTNISQWSREYHTALNKLVTLESLIPLSTTSGEAVIRQTVIKDMQHIFDIVKNDVPITGGVYQNVPHHVGEEEEPMDEQDNQE